MNMKQVVVVLVACAMIGAPARAPARPTLPSATCTQADIAPTTISAAPPLVPDVAQHYGIGGTVTVAVTLDSNGAEVGTSIVRSPAPIFDAPALAAARAARFSVGRKACHAVGGTFAFFVEFAPDGPAPSLYADPFTFFPGTWRCATGDRLGLETFVRDPGAPRLLHAALPAPRESFEQNASHIWQLSNARGLALTGYPWIDPVWRFRANDREIDYERIDPTTFVRTTIAGIPSGLRTTTRCTKTGV